MTGRRSSQCASSDACDPFTFDRGLLRRSGEGLRFLAGADEVGRGSLAGPLVCAAVVLDYGARPERLLAGLKDSKQLTPNQREALFPHITAQCVRWSVISISPVSIDARGLHKSNLEGLAEALGALGEAFDLALVDGFDLGGQHTAFPCQAVVGGDRLSAAVAAASVVAKVIRDRLMRSLHALYPEYGFDQHVGYATPRHRRVLAERGPCPLHRLSFAGVQDEALRQLEFPFPT